MAENNNSFYGGLWTLGMFLLISTIVMGVSIVILVAANDYIFYNVYEAAEHMVDLGFLPSDTLNTLEGVAETAMEVLNYIDFFWVIMFLVFIIQFFKNCYLARREGYFSVFGFISFGVMAMLFILNLIVTYNEAIYDLFFNQILEQVELNLTFFDLYLDNFQIVNLIIMVVGIIINFVPFDINLYQKRKDTDLKEIQ